MLAGIFLITILCMVSAESIDNYNVPQVVPLNNNLTIYGDYSEGGQKLCAFFIFDLEDQNQVILRLTDEYTFSDGTVYAQVQLTEPLFRRGYDYNAVTKCGTAVVSQTFYIDQKEDIALGITPAALRMDIAWWINGENSMTIFLIGLFILIAAGALYGISVELAPQRI